MHRKKHKHWTFPVAVTGLHKKIVTIPPQSRLTKVSNCVFVQFILETKAFILYSKDQYFSYNVKLNFAKS